ncbi:MAG: hypothetical protein Q6353_002055 [Candidatus Sigynarchaeum springense]
MADDADATARLGFVRAIAEISKAIAIDVYRREPIDEAFYLGAAKEAYDEMFSSLKGAIDLPASSIEPGIRAEIERQRQFFEDMERVSLPFGKAGIQFRVDSLSTIRRDSFWETGIAPQCTVRIGEGYYLLAFAAGPARARIAPDENQGGPAATVIFASPHSILLLPGDETIGGAAGQACQKYLGDFRRVSFPFARSAFQGPGLVNIDHDEPLSTAEMNVLFHDPSIHAVVSNNLYTGFTTIYQRGEQEKSTGPMRLHYWAFKVLAK